MQRRQAIAKLVAAIHRRCDIASPASNRGDTPLPGRLPETPRRWAITRLTAAILKEAAGCQASHQQRTRTIARPVAINAQEAGYSHQKQAITRPVSNS